MARARRSGRGPDYQWSNFGDVENGQDLGAGAAVFGSTGLASGVPHTCVRVRGKVGVVLDTGGVDESAMILCGLMRVTSDFFATGVAPELFTSAADEASWVWQGVLYVNSGSEGAIVTDFLSDTIEVDSKAMRKFKVNDVLAFVFESPAALQKDQAGTYDLTYFFHVLSAD